MIASLRGQVLSLSPTQVVLEVGGLGLRLACPLPTTRQLTQGQVAYLHTHLAWREDGPALYGFASPEALQMFEMLISVNGVGGQTALMVLSSAELPQIAQSIAQQDVNTLKRWKGVGPKTAERIILELKDKVGPLTASVAPAAKPQQAEALQALLQLGYTRTVAEARLAEAQASLPAGSAEDWIRAVLRMG